MRTKFVFNTLNTKKKKKTRLSILLLGCFSVRRRGEETLSTLTTCNITNTTPLWSGHLGWRALSSFFFSEGAWTNREIEMLGCREWSLDGAVLTTPYVLQVCVCVCVCVCSICFPVKLHWNRISSDERRLLWKEESVESRFRWSGWVTGPNFHLRYLLNLNFLERKRAVTSHISFHLSCALREFWFVPVNTSTAASCDSLQPTSTDRTFLSVMSCCCAATAAPQRVTFT